MIALAEAPRAYLRTRWITRGGVSRARFAAWQGRAVDRWLSRAVPQVARYAGFRGDLGDLPITDKASVMADFADFNRGGITAEDGWAAFAGSGEINGVSIGSSTGTSGNRSLYAITEAERFRWLGTIIAKAIPDVWRVPERVAVVLPQSSALYRAAQRTRRIRLEFYDLRDGPEVWLPALMRFDPTTIVAPPRVLRLLAEGPDGLAPRRVFAGGETLDPTDRAVIEARFGAPMGQIYMASEGLFGVTCRNGALHLAEDANHFELEPVGDGLVSPIISSFQRSYQIMARYRMNDLLRMKAAPCACGSPLRVVEEVVGRMDDAFTFGTGAGGVLITPDILRNAVLDADRRITDYRIRRVAAERVTLTLPPEVPQDAADGATAALREAFARRGIAPKITAERANLVFEPGAKLRRVMSDMPSERTVA